MKSANQSPKSAPLPIDIDFTPAPLSNNAETFHIKPKVSLFKRQVRHSYTNLSQITKNNQNINHQTDPAIPADPVNPTDHSANTPSDPLIASKPTPKLLQKPKTSLYIPVSNLPNFDYSATFTKNARHSRNANTVRYFTTVAIMLIFTILAGATYFYFNSHHNNFFNIIINALNSNSNTKKPQNTNSIESSKDANSTTSPSSLEKTQESSPVDTTLKSSSSTQNSNLLNNPTQPIPKPAPQPQTPIQQSQPQAPAQPQQPQQPQQSTQPQQSAQPQQPTTPSNSDPAENIPIDEGETNSSSTNSDPAQAIPDEL